jgi:flagellar basal body-associated protein FliL
MDEESNQNSKKPDKKKTTGIQIIIALIIIVVLATIWVLLVNKQSCDTFRYWQTKDIPARCLNQYSH